MSPKIEVRVCNSLEDICYAAVDIFSDLVKKIRTNTFIVPGGKTPILFYQYLAKRLDNWNNINLLLSDERIVNENNPESNSGMIKRNFLNLIDKKIQQPNFVPIMNGFIPEQSEEIVHLLNTITKPLMPPKAAFLGIGDDGHTASLFPGLIADNNHSTPFILVNRKHDPYQRISISLKILSRIPLLVFLVTGKEKKYILKRIIDNSNNINLLPVQHIIRNAQDRVIILCDRAAKL